MEINQSIITAGIGFIGGVILTFITPWVKWKIEKKRKRYEERSKLLNEFKNILDNSEFNRKEVVNSSNYYLIRKHLSEESINILESSTYTVRYVKPNNPIDYSLKPILRDISKLEEKWKIK